MIDIATLKEYIKVLEDSSLQSLEISDGTDTLRMEKPFNDGAPAAFGAQPAVSGDVQVYPTADGPTAVYAADQPAANGGKSINAPIVGVFYAAPSPDSEPYVSVGKKVRKGDTVCIIEAMKCMNEIQAEEDGEIVDVLVNNGDLVEFDQPLFSIK